MEFSDCNYQITMARQTKEEITKELAEARKKITELERQLNKPDDFFRKLADNARDMLYHISLADGNFKYVSPSVYDILGYTPSDFYANPMLIKEIIHPEWKEYFRKEWENLKQGRMPDYYEYQVIHKNGPVIWLRQSNVLIKDENNQAVAIEGLVRDITERRIIEEELLNSKDSLHTAQKIAKLGRWAWHLETGSVDLSSEAYSIFGLDPQNVKLSYDTYMNSVHPDDRNYIQSVIDMALRNEITENIVHRVITRDNKEKYVNISAELITDSSGTPIKLTGVIQDITDRKTAQIALSASEEKYRTIFEGVADGIIYSNRKGIVLDVNSMFTKLTGISKEEVIGRNAFVLAKKFLTFKNIPEMLKRISNLVQGKPIEIYELQFNNRILQIRNISNKQNNTNISLLTDVTFGKMSEKALKESEERARQFFDNISNGVAIYKPFNNGEDFIIVDINQAGLKFSNISKEEVIGRKVSEVFPGVKDLGLFKVFQKVLKTGKPQNHPLSIYEDNRVQQYVENYVFKLPSGFIAAIYEDTSERRKAEQLLRDSEEKNRALSETTFEALFFSDKGYCIECNQSACNLFGYTYEELIGIFGTDVIAQESKSLVKHNMLTGYNEPYEVMAQKKDGTTFWAEIHGKSYNYKGRKVRVTAVKDITTRKNAEKGLIESEEKYRKLIETSLTGTFLIQDDKFIFCNKRFSDILKYDTPEEVIGKKVSDIVAPEYWPLIKEQISNRQTEQKEYNNLEIQAVRKDRKVVDVEVIGRNISFNNKPAIQGNIIDITEQKKIREELQRISKLESLGILAGGIAHNFKNLLTSMSLSVELAQMSPEKADKHLKKIMNSIQQATALATRFQTFSTGGEPVKQTLMVEKIINEALSIALSGSNVIYDFHIDEGLNLITADPKQLNEVFMNLFINAEQAMPKGGKIIINASNVDITDSKLFSFEGSYVKISVTDQGNGIARDDLNNIFTPFFTTKESGNGLGLSTVHFIIKKHDGHISVNSKEGEGTTFDIYLPAVFDSEVAFEDEIDSNLSFDKKIKILLMDDDKDILRNFSEIAKLLKINITFAHNGYEAIDAFEEQFQNSPFDLVILDLTIKGSNMGGEEILQQLKDIDSTVKSIVFSGHSTKPIVANYEEYGFDGRLEKPIRINDFIREVDRVINL